jgi:hypothetical protein
MSSPVDFEPLLTFLQRIPAIGNKIGTGVRDDGTWLIKFQIDTKHPGAWKAVMDLGYVLNWLALADPLPTIFKPVSPPPDMNGNDPTELLMWLVECPKSSFTPTQCAHALDVSLFDYPPRCGHDE